MVDRGRRGASLRRGLAVCLVILAGAGCTPLDDVMAGIFGRSMRDQPDIDPYEQPMPPPENSVPFAAGNFPASRDEVNLGQPEGTPIPPPVTPGDLLGAGGDPEAYPDVTGLENPVPADEASLARGQEVYDRACAPCHGVEADGNGPVAQAQVVFGVSLLTEQSLALGESYIYSMIRAGRGAMPPYGHQISHYDRWHVVNYLLQLQGRLDGSEDAPESAEPSDN